MLAVLIVGGVGSVHLATAGLLHLSVLVGVIALLGCVPAAHRLITLRHSAPVATWEPTMLTATGLLLALCVLITR